MNMSKPIIDMTFENKDFSEQKLPSKEYDNCIFINCDFTNTDISVVSFLECRFDTCSFNKTLNKKTSFQEVIFYSCKMLGMNFSNCSDFLFQVEFDRCHMDYTSFYDFPLKNTLFNHCSLKEVDFTAANISGAILNECDLYGAIFDTTIAENADFRSAINYIIDPERNKIRKAKFNISGVLGLLSKYDLEIEL